MMLLPLATLAAQGVGSSGIRGSVRTAEGLPAAGDVQVTHESTGVTVTVRASNGRFLVQGLEPGGPYAIALRSIGAVPQRRHRVFLTLGEFSEVAFVLERVAARLDTMRVTARDQGVYATSPAGGGTGMTFANSLLQRLPSLNRDLYDFVRLVPQVSTKISLPNPGLSGGGVGFRFNNFLIDGVSDRTLGGGVSGAFAGAKSISLDAVQEYQVLLAPYDVRYGDFAGALVNAVTKAGTNAFHGTAFGYGRNDRIARRDPSDGRGPYEKAQYGFSLGGPIARDRMHFFVATELQHFSYPAAGPYLGQPADADRPLPVDPAYLNQFEAIMKAFGLTAGSPAAVTNSSPLENVFARLDLAVPRWNSRVVLSSNYSGSNDLAFSRAARDTFSLSSYQVTRIFRTRVDAVHLHTALPRAGGGHNELLFSHRTGANDRVGAVQQPIVRVGVPSISGGRITLNSGTHESAQNAWSRPTSFTIKDNLTLPIGTRHVVTLGAEAERFRILRADALGSFGAWTFASLRDLELRIADRYEVRTTFGATDTPINGTQYALYLGDEWRATEHITLTGGLRADGGRINERAPYHRVVDSLFGRRTDEMPRQRVEISPRVGFTWDALERRGDRIRGGAGVFAGRYPLAWAQTSLSSYGVGGLLRCTSLGGSQFPPVFNPDYTTAPTSCSDGASITTSRPGDVDVLDRNLRMMRVLRASIAHDRRLPGSLLLTNEGLFTRALSDFVVTNLNLTEPVATDRNGRAMYGSLRSNASVMPSRRSAFSEVIEIQNTARNYSYQFTTRLETARTAAVSGSLSYTFSRVRDVQTPVRVNTTGTALWGSARVTGGRHDDLTASISSNDIPHRVVAVGSYTFPWRRAPTDVSFYYVGESGRPFTFTAYGTSGRGDLNADGSSANDPVYVPRNARDTMEIQFSGISDSLGADGSTAARGVRERLQQAAFEAFIERTPCLKRQRGAILARNTCREPWSNTTMASVRQVIPFSGRAAEVQLDVFNVLNLLHRDWGKRRDAVPALLEHVGQTTGVAPRSVFRFSEANAGETTAALESAFQLQLALRYRF